MPTITEVEHLRPLADARPLQEPPPGVEPTAFHDIESDLVDVLPDVYVACMWHCETVSSQVDAVCWRRVGDTGWQLRMSIKGNHDRKRWGMVVYGDEEEIVRRGGQILAHVVQIMRGHGVELAQPLVCAQIHAAGDAAMTAILQLPWIGIVGPGGGPTPQA